MQSYIWCNEVKHLKFQFDVETTLNEFKPLMKTTFNGLVFKIINNPPNSTKIKFGISKTVLNSEEDCICGFKDCFNVSNNIIFLNESVNFSVQFQKS